MKKGLRHVPQPLGFSGGPCRIRTYNLLIKSQLLYRVELMAHAGKEPGTWRAWEESNIRTRLRRPVLYPLSYRRLKMMG